MGFNLGPHSCARCRSAGCRHFGFFPHFHFDSGVKVQIAQEKRDGPGKENLDKNVQDFFRDARPPRVLAGILKSSHIGE
jgi:hypothetical protein